MQTNTRVFLPPTTLSYATFTHTHACTQFLCSPSSSSIKQNTKAKAEGFGSPKKRDIVLFSQPIIFIMTILIRMKQTIKKNTAAVLEAKMNDDRAWVLYCKKQTIHFDLDGECVRIGRLYGSFVKQLIRPSTALDIVPLSKVQYCEVRTVHLNKRKHNHIYILFACILFSVHHTVFWLKGHKV